MENHGAGVSQTAASLKLLPEEEVGARLKASMKLLGAAIDSPQTQLILRNAALMLAEIGESSPSPEKVHELLTNDQARLAAIRKLSGETPQYWSDEWNALWRKDVDPLLSESQQRIARRAGLLTFWSAEYESLPAEVRDHVAQMLGAMTGGK